MEEIRSHWHIPSIAHYCKLFGNCFDLPNFDYDDLEFAFLSRVSVESDESNFGSSQTNLLRQLIVSLLNGYFTHNVVNTLNWELYLRKLIQIQWVTVEKRNSPFVTYVNGDEQIVSFDDLPLRTRIEIVYNLCEYRLLREESCELFKDVDADEYRIEPLGKDSKGYVYWYFYGTRLYRENPTVADEIESKLKKIEEFKRRDEEIQRKAVDAKKKADEERIRKEEIEAKRAERLTKRRELPPKITGYRTGLRERKGTVVNGVCNKSAQKSVSPKSETPKPKTPKKSLRSNVETESAPPIPVITLEEFQEAWSLVCYTESDWIELTEKFKKSKSKCETAFGKLLQENFVSILSDIFAKIEKEKQKIEKQKLFELLPRRVSTRIEIKKLQKEHEESQEKGYIYSRNRPEDQSLDKETADRKYHEQKKLERDKRAQLRLKIMEERAERARLRNEGIHQELSEEFNDTINDNIQITNEQSESNSLYEGLEKVLLSVNGNRDAWPFKEPVDMNLVPMYYQVIEHPIDLKLIGEKISMRKYSDFSEVESDFKLMVNNCETFNGPKNGYTLMAYGVWRAFKKAVKKYLNHDLSIDERSAFLYPPKPANTNIKPAIEAKKKKSRNKRRSTYKALDVLAQAAERAVKDTSSISSTAASSPRSSISMDECTNDAFPNDDVTVKPQPIQLHGDILARFLCNSNANNNVNTISTASLPTVSTKGNLTFKSLEEWSKTIKQSGNSVVLPQHSVIISSSPVTNTCATNGPVFRQSDGGLISLKLVPAANTMNNNVPLYTSTISNPNDVNANQKRVVIKLSRAESGHAWRPVIVNPLPVLQTQVNQINVSQSGSLSIPIQQSHGLQSIPTYCVPVKKRVYVPPDNAPPNKVRVSEQIALSHSNNSSNNIVLDNSSHIQNVSQLPSASLASSQSFQITGIQQHVNSNIKVLQLKKVEHQTALTATVSQPNDNPYSKVVILPISTTHITTPTITFNYAAKS